MKYRWLIVLLTLFLFLSGCNRTTGEETLPTSSNTNTTETSVETTDVTDTNTTETSVETTDVTDETTEASTETTVEQMEEPTAPTIPEGVTLLTEAEIAWFNTEFFATEIVDGVIPFNIHNKFLIPQYGSPDEINLRHLFYDGVARDTQITQEEMDAYDEATGSDAPVDNFKIPREDMERIFFENTGLTIEQSQKIGLDTMTYLEDYDAYYLEHSDSGYAGCEVQKGYKAEDGVIVLLYQQKARDLFGAGQVTLSLQEDGSYWFVANWFNPFL